jgi:hypothetical protein
MRRRIAWIVMCCLSWSAMLLHPAHAESQRGPVISRYTDGGTFVDDELCGYPIQVRWHEHGRVYEWFDADGNLDHLVVHKVFSEVDRANGKVATGVDRQKLVNDQQGTYLFTGSWIFFLPDGSHIQSAGRIREAYDGTIVSEHGQHPVDEGHLAELFCPAMA